MSTAAQTRLMSLLCEHTEGFVCQRGPRGRSQEGGGWVGGVRTREACVSLRITCLPLRLHPERSRPAGRRWQTPRPSVPVGRPAASVATLAGRALPAAAAPAGARPNQNRDVTRGKADREILRHITKRVVMAISGVGLEQRGECKDF